MMASSPQETPESKPRNDGRSHRIFALGEMAERTREFDWSKSILGPIERWPQSLVITVNNLLATKHPMFLWWGRDLIQFYNDAYRRSIGSDKHPSALGPKRRRLLARDLAHHRATDSSGHVDRRSNLE